MSPLLQLGTSLEQNIYAFGRYETGNCDQLRNVILMRDRLESLLIESVRNDSNAVRLVNIRSHIIGKSTRNRHQPVTHMLQLPVNRDQELMLKPPSRITPFRINSRS